MVKSRLYPYWANFHESFSKNRAIQNPSAIECNVIIYVQLVLNLQKNTFNGTPLVNLSKNQGFKKVEI